MSNQQTQIKVKIITIGDSNVGKTALVNRYIKNEFIPTVLTSGFGEHFRELTMKDNGKISLNITDTAGQEKFKSMGSQYFKNVDAILFVFDLSNKQTFTNINNWIKFFKENTSDEDIPKYLIGNKKDLEKEVSEDMIELFLEEHKDFVYKETSSKEDTNTINDMFQEIAEKLYELYKTNKTSKNKNIKLGKGKKNNGKCVIKEKCSK